MGYDEEVHRLLVSYDRVTEDKSAKIEHPQSPLPHPS